VSEAHLRRAQEVARIGSWSLDLVKGELYWSDEVYRVFGVERGTPLDYERFLGAVHPEDREDVDRAWQAALAGETYDLEHRIVAGGQVYWVREKAEVEFDETGRPLRGIGIVQDVTARRAAEAEAARLEAELAHLTRVATLGEFSAALAHELNQPLAAILSNAQAAQRFLDAESPDLPEIREILDDIVRDDQRARDVILRVRELSRKGAGRREPAALGVNALVGDILRIVRGDLLMRKVALETDLADGLPPVTGDAVQLQQVLLNLILNALEAMEGRPERRLILRTRAAGDGQVELEVADTGNGLAPGAAERLFEPFFSTKDHGMGMGLAINRAIVEAHGGRIRAEARDGGGTSFVVGLPAGKEAA
jgi:PAS domain S-box-containing protein